MKPTFVIFYIFSMCIVLCIGVACIVNFLFFIKNDVSPNPPNIPSLATGDAPPPPLLAPPPPPARPPPPASTPVKQMITASVQTHPFECCHDNKPCCTYTMKEFDQILAENNIDRDRYLQSNPRVNWIKKKGSNNTEVCELDFKASGYMEDFLRGFKLLPFSKSVSYLRCPVNHKWNAALGLWEPK